MSSNHRIAAFTLVFIASVALYLEGKPTLLENYSFGRAYYDREGHLLRLETAADQQYRHFVPLEFISPKLIEATLLYEDRFFYWHPGVNVVALAEAAFNYAFGHGPKRGASTITMQLARLRFGINSSSLPGKMVQILRAIQLELYYPKRQLLEAYLNLAPYGGNIEGIGAASLIYFHHDPAQLTMAEALALAVLPQNPNGRAPTGEGRERPEMTAARQRLVEAWLTQHRNEKEEAEVLRIPLRYFVRADLPFLAPHFIDSLKPTGASQSIRTTIDVKLQQQMENQIKAYVEQHHALGIRNAVALLVSSQTLEVLAEVGSADFFDAQIYGQVNGAIASRSPGSALKPFLYALALDQGLIHPLSLLKDSQVRFGLYTPENFDSDFIGPITATDALINSRNVPAVTLAARLSHGGLYGMLNEIGVKGLREEDFYGLALVLGGGEISMEEAAALYAMLANGGVYRPLVHFRGEEPRAGKRLLSPEASYLTLDMLAQATRPGQAYQDDWVRDRQEVSWKTGTSFGFRDAWSIGVTGPYVLAVWVGNFDGHGNPAFIGREAAAPLFFQIIDSLRDRIPPRSADPPAGLNLQQIDICPISGKLPGPYCPSRKKVWFIPGVSPIDRCDIHRVVYLNRTNNLRACNTNPAETRTEVFEFWPTDLEHLFILAGMPRRKPPPFSPECAQALPTPSGSAPKIITPQPNLVYTMRPDEPQNSTVPFTAIADGDAAELNWFVNGRFVGRVRPGETLFWQPTTGRQIVRVVDDHGRADSVEIKVETVL